MAAKCMSCDSLNTEWFRQAPFRFEICTDCGYWFVDTDNGQEFSAELFHKGTNFGARAAMLLRLLAHEVTIVAPGITMTGILCHQGPANTLGFYMRWSTVTVHFILPDVLAVQDDCIYLVTPTRIFPSLPCPTFVEVTDAHMS